MPGNAAGRRVVVALPRGASGGMARVAGDLAAGLAAAGRDAVAVAPAGLRLPSLLTDLLDGFRAGRRARGGVLSLHTGGPQRMGPLLIGARLAGCRRVAVTLHGTGSRVRWPLHRRLVARLARTIVVPSAGAARLHRKGGLRTARLTVIPNGVPPLPAAARADARERFGLAPDAFVVASAARFVPEKGLATLIDALAGLPGAVLLAAGDGPARDDLQRAAAHHLPGRHAFTGWLDREGIASFLAAADVLAVPSGRESFGLTVVEAALAGCPVVASDLPVIREVTASGTTALLVPARDPVALRTALERLRDDAPLRAHLAAAARAFALEEYALERMVDRYGAVFRA